jgi:tetratricopeptide (TPR) repeat protein
LSDENRPLMKEGRDTLRSMMRWTRRSGGRVCLIALALAPTRGYAQQPQFTRQIILIPPFDGERRLGNSAADAIRGRVQRFYNRREAQVISEHEMAQVLERSGIIEENVDPAHIRTLARHLRADEIIYGNAERSQGALRLWGRLVLTRDPKLWQPIPAVRAPSLDSAGSLMARVVEGLRRQLTPLRHCENNLRDGRGEDAVASARTGVRASPQGTLVRSCLVNAMIAIGAPSNEVLREAMAILAIHPTSYWGLDAAARASDVMGSRDSAATFWLRLAATDTTDLVLAKRVLGALLAGSNAKGAQPLATSLTVDHPDDVELWRLRWQAEYTTRAWKEATVTGERLRATDSLMRVDSTFFLRLAAAHRSNDDPVRAISIAAEGVTRFPKDARLYLLYSELIQADGRVTVERGIARFPDVAELHMLQAQELRRAGKTGEAVEPLRRAMQLDPRLGQGYLVMAQAQSDLGNLDSTYLYTRRALDAGDDPATVAQFALARGNAIYRAANGTRQRSDFQMALRFLWLADSVAGTPQSRFLTGATALAISQSAATEAPTLKDCGLSRLAGEMLPLAREKLTAGAQVAPDATRQYLAYLDQLEPIVTQQIQSLCSGS